MKETPWYSCQGKYARRVFQNTLANVPSAVDRKITESVIRASSSHVLFPRIVLRSEITTGTAARSFCAKGTTEHLFLVGSPFVRDVAPKRSCFTRGYSGTSAQRFKRIFFFIYLEFIFYLLTLSMLFILIIYDWTCVDRKLGFSL